MKWTLTFVLLILFSSCKKKENKTYTIQGQILESSSNPVPVSNYLLSFYQKANSALLGGVSGVDTTTKTDINGKFIFQYSPHNNYGLTPGTSNPNQISISGADREKYKDLSPQWYNVASQMNVDLNTIYLYKKIEMLVRKIQFNNSLNTGDSLEFITTDSSGASYKILTGPIASGTLLTVDTIMNCKISRFDLSSKEYILSAALKKPSYEKDSSVVMTTGDETFREILMTY
jgi:hypothetical protein